MKFEPTKKEIIKSVYTYVNAINNKKLKGYTDDGLKSRQFAEAWKMAEGLDYGESIKTPCGGTVTRDCVCLLYTSPSPRDGLLSRMPSSA